MSAELFLLLSLFFQNPLYFLSRDAYVDLRISRHSIKTHAEISSH